MEGGVLGWVALLSLQDSEKVATTLDKHKQGHPLGRLTPRAYVDACQPGLRPGGGVWTQQPTTLPQHPISTGSFPSGKSASACKRG